MSRREELRAKKRKKAMVKRVSLIIVISAVNLIIAGIIILPKLEFVQNIFNPLNIIVPTENPQPMAKDNTIGDPEAPIKVEIFSDFQCPACQQFAQQIEPGIIEQFVKTGKAFITYIPISGIGPESVLAAQAAFCAMDQGKFWEYHDIIFANWDGENQGTFSTRRLVAFAQKLNLEDTLFRNCLTNEKYLEKTNQDQAYGIEKGVKNIPSFLVNGTLLKGAQQLVSTLNAELTKAETIVPKENPRPLASGTAMGDPNAPVKVQIYSDFQCPFCKQYTDNTEQQIVDQYVKTNKVYYEYVALKFLGPESVATALAAYCAAEQGKFWEYHDIIFANITGENVGTFTNEKLLDMADKLNLKSDPFKKCLDSKKYDQTLAENDQKSKAVGVKGTPAFLVNGKIASAGQLSKTIEAALTSAP